MVRVFILLVCVSFNLEAKHQKLTLQKAMDMKLLSAKATSLGGHQGFCMKLGLKNLTKDSLIVLIEAGRRLNSADDKNQDILIVKEELIVLRTGEEKSVKIKGYCCQANNHSPAINAVYHLNKLADSNLVLLARYLNAGKFESNVEQQAVWAISDKHVTAGITSSCDSLVVPLRRFVAAIKGEKEPWYTIVSYTHVYSNGAMLVTPLQLKGVLEYSNAAGDYITLSVTNEKGLPVCLIKNEWLNASVKSAYNIDLPIKGLAKGKYTIELRATGKQLAKKEFEI